MIKIKLVHNIIFNYKEYYYTNCRQIQYSSELNFLKFK